MSLLKQQFTALITFVVAGVIAGALAGGATTWFLVQQYWQVPDKQETRSFIEQTREVKEDSQTIKVVDRVASAVVSISISKEIADFSGRTGPDIFPFDDFFDFGFPEKQQPRSQDEVLGEKIVVGGGSGFLVSSDGMILTNRHVVDDTDATYTVTLSDQRTFEALVLAKDPVHDMALIKIDAKDLPVVSLGDSDTLQIGQTVIAIGDALAEYHNTVTKGVISGVNRRVSAGNGLGRSEIIEEAIQTDAAINPGNSGGPLLNLQGEVIGINTAVTDPARGQLIGFAIPVNQAKRMVESVEQYGRIVRPWLGVRYTLVTKDFAKRNQMDIDYGALIVRGDAPDLLAVIPGSPADKAGFQENDIILEINNERIDENNSLARVISELALDDTVTIKVYHKGDIKEVKVTLKEFPKDS